MADRFLDDVIEYSEGRVATHYYGCYRVHAGCLASLLKELNETEETDGEQE